MTAVMEILLGAHTLTGSPAEVPEARKEVCRLAAKVITDEDLLYDLGLLASEAITNATIHGTGIIDVFVSHSPDRRRIRVEVLDQGPRGRDANPRTDHNRGFKVFEGLATGGWRLEMKADQTICWFEVAC